MPQQNIKNLKDTINQNILPLVDNLLQDSIGAREVQFFKKIQSDLIFLELSTLMFSDFFFTDEQLEKIDALLENCEQIASTFSANTGVPN